MSVAYEKNASVPWARLGAETIAIVGSILLAFAIDAWWAGNLQDREELRTVEGLQNQFLAHKDLLEFSTDLERARIGIIEDVMTMIQSASWTERAEGIDRKLGQMLIPATTDFGSGPLESLLSSGRMDVISDRQVRQKLIAWEGVRDELSDDEVIIRALITDKILPYMASGGLPMAGIMEPLSGLEHGYDISSARTLEGSPNELDKLFSDAVFFSFVEQLYAFLQHSLLEKEWTMTAIEDLLAHLDAYQQQ